MTRNEWAQSLAYAALFLILAAILWLNALHFQEAGRDQDIYFSFVEGQRILAGENPYARVLAGDFRTNDKYATYFPLFYELSALVQSAGLRDYENWLKFWRVLFALFDVGITILLFDLCRRQGEWLLAVFAALLWGLGRWSLFVVLIGQLDAMPIFFLLLSLALLPGKPALAFVLYGISLSLKQIGVFVFPLYLIWAWQSRPSDGVRAAVMATGWIAAVPLLTALPFLIWNAEGFLASVLFSATRDARSHFGALSVDASLNLTGLTARLPMLIVFTCIYGLAILQRVGRYTACLLIFMSFVGFNSVLYMHYPSWAVPFVPLAVLDQRTVSRQEGGEKDAARRD